MAAWLRQATDVLLQPLGDNEYASFQSSLHALMRAARVPHVLNGLKQPV